MAVQVGQTDDIGEYLQREYGSKPPNTHIGCFYIKLGQEISESPMSQQKEAIATLNRILGPGHWVKTEPGWDGIIFFRAHAETAKNEREIEANINDTIRFPLITDLSGQSPSHIMFSRACLYKEKDNKCMSNQKITTDTIGKIMEDVYEHDDIGSTHIEYFYLFVQAVVREGSSDTKQVNIKEEKVHSKALEELKKLPGNWKSVEPQETWPGTFFGFFPKEMQPMTERKREKILNGEVRMPLIERLGAKLDDKKYNESLGLKLKVQVIITRACKYTPIKMDTS